MPLAPPGTIVVLGSSTAFGVVGPTTVDSSWVARYRRYIEKNYPGWAVENLAGVLTTYSALPTLYPPPAGRPMPSPAHNVTKAFSLRPAAIIVNFPSNDIAMGYTLEEQKANFEILYNEIAAAGVQPFFCTTQPRTAFNASERQAAITLRDWIKTRFPDNYLDFWSPIANDSGKIREPLGYQDSIHLNDMGHRALFEYVVGRDLPQLLRSREPLLPSVTPAPSFPAAMSPNEQPLTVHFGWEIHPSPPAYRTIPFYQIQVAFDSLFSKVVLDTSIVGRNISWEAPKGSTAYYWRVRSVNIAGKGSWSEAWSFRTRKALVTPKPSASVSDSVFTGEPVLLVWEADGLAKAYHFQLFSGEGYGNLVYDTVISTAAIRLDSLREGRYRWRVRSVNDSDLSVWADGVDLVVKTPPDPPPLLKAPQGGVGGLPVFVLLEWEPLPNRRFHLQVAHDTAFGSLAFEAREYQDTSALVGPLEEGKTYYWRVRSVAGGVYGMYSAVRSFTTKGGETALSNHMRPLVWRNPQGVWMELKTPAMVSFTYLGLDGRILGRVPGRAYAAGRHALPGPKRDKSGSYLVIVDASSWREAFIVNPP